VAVNSSFLGAARVSGQEADAFARKITHARGTKAASASAQNGKHMADAFVRRGMVVLSLKKPQRSK